MYGEWTTVYFNIDYTVWSMYWYLTRGFSFTRTAKRTNHDLPVRYFVLASCLTVGVEHAHMQMDRVLHQNGALGSLGIDSQPSAIDFTPSAYWPVHPLIADRLVAAGLCSDKSYCSSDNKWRLFGLSDCVCTMEHSIDRSSSSYPSVFWLVGSSPSGIVASHSFHCCITVSCCISDNLL
jgi:hypothetical protein